MKILENGRTLDASFKIEPGKPDVMLVLESRSGTRGTPHARNTEYERGLEVLLERLKAAGINIKAIRLHPASGRLGTALDLGSLGPPVLLDRVSDLHELRLAMSRAQMQTDRQPGARGGGNPTKRLRLYLSVESPGTDVGALERRLAGLETRRYWALFADPSVYRIDDAIANPDVDNWTTRGKAVHAGDRALVWRGKGGGRAERGVVALGEVVSDPVERDDSSNPNWFDRTQAGVRSPRVDLRYVVPNGLPLLETGPHADLLHQLPIARARGGTVFEVKPELWHRVLAAAGGWVERPTADHALELIAEAIRSQDGLSPDRRRGQGYGLSTAERRAVEKRAMDLARSHFEALHWAVTDTSRSESYDLSCRKGGVELRVEVKGTTGPGSTVILTRNEVKHARERYPGVALLIVSGIQLTRGAEPTAAGGTLRLHQPWAIDEAALSPLAFDYAVPTGGESPGQ